MATTRPQSWLDAPHSDNCVRVRMINTTSDMLLSSKLFVEPVLPGREQMSMVDMAFLIENPRNDKKLLFDLGVRKDFWNLTPRIRKQIDVIAKGLRVERDVPEILKTNGVALSQIDDIIWSHAHWDHTGVLHFGPGLSKIKPGYPEDEDGRHPSTDFKDRETREITFTTDLNIGGFKANDFYGDGSFFLLETPGHAEGHMCALARVGQDPISKKSTFILLGGDVCHFCGDFRPNHARLLSKDYDSLLGQHPQFPQHSPNEPPLSDAEKHARRETPWYKLSSDDGTAYNFPSTEVAQKTVDTLTARFESADNVFVALAHDNSLSRGIPTLNDQPNQDMNDWFESGWKDSIQWKWINDLDSGSKSKRLVDGFHKDGIKYSTLKELTDSLRN